MLTWTTRRTPVRRIASNQLIAPSTLTLRRFGRNVRSLDDATMAAAWITASGR